MKTIMFAAAAAVAMAATPAMADTIQAEVRFGDLRGANDSTEFKVEYFAPLTSTVKYGAELQVKQKDNAGSVTGKVSGKLGVTAPQVLGFNTDLYGEFGRNLAEGDAYNFWGAGVKTSRKVVGPIGLVAGYRHREGFGDASQAFVENRLNAGLTYNVTDNNKVGVTYYRTTGTSRQDTIGVGLTHTF